MASAKTGALLRAACLLGAHSFPASSALRSAVAAFGCHFGLALQLVDDLLDIVSTEELAGKAVGVDFARRQRHAAGGAGAAIRTPTDGELLRPELDQASRSTAQPLLQQADQALLSTVRPLGIRPAWPRTVCWWWPPTTRPQSVWPVGRGST